MGYGDLVYYPHTKKCKQIIKNAQRRATRLVPEIREPSYQDRLAELNLPSMDYRRKRFDMIQVFKIIHKIDDIEAGIFFDYAENSGTRGHCLKLAKPKAHKAHKSVCLHSFGHRTVSVWNNLPQDIVTCDTVNSFKSRLDKFWRDTRFDISEMY